MMTKQRQSASASGECLRQTGLTVARVTTRMTCSWRGSGRETQTRQRAPFTAFRVAFWPYRPVPLAICFSFVILTLAGCGQIITPIPTPTPAAITTRTFANLARFNPPRTPSPAVYTPLATRPPTATPTPVIYTVQPGDNLGVIANRYGISVLELQQTNNIVNPRTLQIGQELQIPQIAVSEGGFVQNRPTPTPIPFAHQKIHFSFTPIGGLWVLGEVLNNSFDTLEQVRVGVRLLDSQNRTLAESDGLVLLNLVNPGEVAPFAILFAEAPEEFANFEIFPLSGVKAYEGGYYQDLAVENLTNEGEDYSSYTVRGNVRNIGSQEAVDLQVILTAYDSLGRVVGTRKIEPEHNVVAPGGETSFETILVPFGGPVERIHAAAQGRRFPTGN